MRHYILRKGKEGNSFFKGDLPEGGVWRTIRGAKVYIKDGKVIAGPDNLKGEPLDLDKQVDEAVKAIGFKDASIELGNKLTDDQKKQIKEGFVESYNDYNFIHKDTFVGIGVLSEDGHGKETLEEQDAYGLLNMQKTIKTTAAFTISDRFKTSITFNDLKPISETDKKDDTKFFTVGETAKDTMIHEFGHLMMKYFEDQDDMAWFHTIAKEIKDELREVLNNEGSEAMGEKAKELVSLYATQNESELFAELFTDYQKNKGTDRLRYYPDKFGKALEKIKERGYKDAI